MSTRTELVESVLAALSTSIVPERFGGDAMLVVAAAVIVAAWSIIGAMRWRASRELRFPGLEDAHAWERIGNAPAYTTTSDGVEEVRIIPRGSAQQQEATGAEAAAPDDAQPAQPAVAATTGPADRIIIDDLAAVHDFTELRDEHHRRIGRVQRRIALLAVAGAMTAVLLVTLL